MAASENAAIVGHGDACVWNFGNTIPHVTVNTLGGVAEYGTPNIARYGGTVISAVKANPQLAGRCLQAAVCHPSGSTSWVEVSVALMGCRPSPPWCWRPQLFKR